MTVKQGGKNAWIRSQPFPTPATGRVSVMVWLRIADPAQQPPLRLAIEGKLNGEVYYRYATVGRGTDVKLADNWPTYPYLFHVDDLPARGLTDLSVGFDLMGPGTVWIDDVQVLDRWFYQNERDELLKKIALAKKQLYEGKVVRCHRFLDSYWPRFLLQHVPPPTRMAQNPRRAPAVRPKPAPPKPKGLERFLPKFPF